MSVSPILCAMELPSPSNYPYHHGVYENELDLDFGEDFDENEKADVSRRDKLYLALVSHLNCLQKKLCTSLSNITSKESG